MKKGNFMKEVESIGRQAAEEIAEKLGDIEDFLMPDGRPFLGEAKSDVKRCAEYLLRKGDQNAQYMYVSDRAMRMSASLAELSVDPAAVHVWDAAFNFAVRESAELEKKMFEKPALFAEAWLMADKLAREQMAAVPPAPPPMEMQPDPMMQPVM